MSKITPTIVWIRNDFRMHDNPALSAAADNGPVLPVFIWDPDSYGEWKPGAASRVWLHHTLERYRTTLEDAGVQLILRQGNTLEQLRDLIEQTGVKRVNWNRRYEPALQETDRTVKAALKKDGIEVVSFPGNLLYEPWTIENKQGKPYKVFTPYWKACLNEDDPLPPVSEVRNIKSLDDVDRLESLTVDQLDLLPAGERSWHEQMISNWEVGEEAAWRRIKTFLDELLEDYDQDRDVPAIDGTSRLSPHLHFGEVGVRRLWASLNDIPRRKQKLNESLDRFRAELGWREFANHLLYHFPHTTDQPLQEKFAKFPWVEDNAALQAWQNGRTGYPMVDAGMRQLWKTGWMHNRVRMIVASFVTKDLLLPWQDGARWFWETLVDADLANNTLGWQWAAGSGADAQPFFRIFNPVTQGQRFDSHGEYVSEWVPELNDLDSKAIHEPWNTNIELGKDRTRDNSIYPAPLIDHSDARERALAAYNAIK